MFASFFILTLFAIFSTRAAVVPHADDEALTLESIPQDIFYAINKVAVLANIEICYNLSLTSETLRKAIIEFARVANDRSIDEVLIGMRFLNQILVRNNRADARLYQELLRRTRVSPNNLALIPSHIQESVKVPFETLPAPNIDRCILLGIAALVCLALQKGWYAENAELICVKFIVMVLFGATFGIGMDFWNVPNRTVSQIWAYERFPVLIMQQYAVPLVVRAACNMVACSGGEKRLVESVLCAVPSWVVVIRSEMPIYLKFLAFVMLLLVSIEF